VNSNGQFGGVVNVAKLKLLAIALFIILLLVSWINLAKSNTQPLVETIIYNDQPHTDINHLKRQFQASNVKTVLAILANLPIGHKNLEKNDDFSETIESTRIVFNQLHDLRTNFDKDEMRQKILDQLLLNEKNLQLAHRILMDNHFTKNAYGESQAIARVYAIKLLARKAEMGDLDPLRTTTRDLSDQLTKLDDISDGQAEDLSDLIEEYILRNGIESTYYPAVLLNELGYSKQTNNIFRKAFFLALQNKDEETLTAFLNQHFPKEIKYK